MDCPPDDRAPPLSILATRMDMDDMDWQTLATLFQQAPGASIPADEAEDDSVENAYWDVDDAYWEGEDE